MSAAVLLSSSFPTWRAADSADVQVDWQAQGNWLKHTWEGLGNVDQMRWMLRRDMQEQLQMAQRELNLRHVRAVGMFDDELRIIGTDPTRFFSENRKEKRINWQILDYILDSLLDIGINPMVTTCFTPTELASGSATTFTTRSNITPPKDYIAWEGLVKNCISHYDDRYGRERLKNWYYEVWNEPNLTGFWTGGMEEYYKLYKITYDAIKSFDPAFRVGGPSTARAEYIGEFLEFATKNDCMPDYIIGHCYNNDSANAPLSPFEGPQADRENKSPNFTAGVVRGVMKILDEFNYQGEVHWNEWGLSWHPYAPVRETANEAAFIVKTMHEVSQLGDYFAYWCLSDIYDQVGYNREAFAGHYGMISVYGLRKPNYFAHQLLTRMGDVQVPVNSKHQSCQGFASKTTNGYQLMLYAFDINYTAKDKAQSQDVTFELPEDWNQQIRLYKIDCKENNILYHWQQMGAPAYLKPEEIKDLQAINQLKESTDQVQVEQQGNKKTGRIKMSHPGVAMLLMGKR